jgi:hypothetical protein
MTGLIPANLEPRRTQAMLSKIGKKNTGGGLEYAITPYGEFIPLNPTGVKLTV